MRVIYVSDEVRLVSEFLGKKLQIVNKNFLRVTECD